MNDLPSSPEAGDPWLKALYELLEDPEHRRSLEAWQALIEDPHIASSEVRARLSMDVFGALAGWLRSHPPSPDEHESQTQRRVIAALAVMFGWARKRAELDSRFRPEDVERVLACATSEIAPPAGARPLRWLLWGLRALIALLIVGTVIQVMLPNVGRHPALTALLDGRTSEAIEIARAHLAEHPQDWDVMLYMAEAQARLGQFTGALATMAEVIDNAPSPERYSLRASIFERAGDWYNATLDRRAALELDPESVPLKNALAWNLSTAPDPYVRNGEEALRLAREVAASDEGQRPAFMDTLAAALAETGDFRRAAQTQRQAMSLASPEVIARGGYEARLRLYESGQPYHQRRVASGS